jgi:hypothetical protein
MRYNDSAYFHDDPDGAFWPNYDAEPCRKARKQGQWTTWEPGIKPVLPGIAVKKRQNNIFWGQEGENRQSWHGSCLIISVDGKKETQGL